MSDGQTDQDADLAMIIADMAQEFLEGCADRLEEVDSALIQLRNKPGSGEHSLLEIKRHIHSLKGMGSTFGYSSISMIAHALEDYFETMFTPSEDGVYDVQLYVDRIREIADTHENLSDETASLMLRDLPLKAKRKTIRKNSQAISILVLMPKGLQRKIVTSELSQFGFSVLIAENSLDAIEKGMRMQPNLFLSSMILEDITGPELAGIFNAIKTTANCPFLLMSATDIDPEERAGYPKNVFVLRKGPKFAREFMAFFTSQGFSSS